MYKVVASSNATNEIHSRKSICMYTFKIPLNIWTETGEGLHSKEPQIEHFDLSA